MLLHITFNIVTVVLNNNVSKAFLKKKDIPQIIFCPSIVKFVLKNKKQFFIKTNENNIQETKQFVLLFFSLLNPFPFSLWD